MTTNTISRRDLLKGTGALIVSFNLFGPVTRMLAQTVVPPLTDSGGLPPDQLDSWLAVAQDGGVTVFTSKVDLGTGTATALGQIVAEELDVAISKIKMEIGDTTKTVDQGRTSASRTLFKAGPQMRQAGAAAREQLLKLASERLDTPVDQLRVTDGVVSVAGSPGKRVTYGNLIGGKRFNLAIKATGEGWDIEVAPGIKPKDPKDYKIVGTPVPRFDLPPKFTGEFVYAQEVRVPGMLHGRVVRPPVINSAPASVDEDSIKHIPGIVKVVREESFLGVVAETEWAAIQAARALKVAWATPPAKFPNGPEEMYDYLKNTKSFAERNTLKGNPAAALSQAGKTVEATYRVPFQMHAMMGPSCAVADVRADSATIWSGSQAPFITRNGVARLLKLPEDKVHFIYREGSGCYGRLEPDDAPEDAALMSRAVGKPVRVQWMRQDENGWEPKGPPQLITIRAGLDAQGNFTAWDYLERTLPWTDARLSPMLASRQTGLMPKEGVFLGGGGAIPYDVENQKATTSGIPWMLNPNPLRTCNLRAPYAPGRTFATESHVDQLASAAGVDPVEFRLRYLRGSDNKRLADALRAAAKQAGWQSRPSPAPAGSGSVASGRGVGLSGLSGTVVAQVADIEVEKTTGKITVKKITVAHDCGLIVNPDGLRNQIEGNVVQGMSRALLEEVQFDSEGIKNLDWSSYPIVRFEDVPDVDIVLINQPTMPTFGAGEASTVAVMAAIANAIFDATGVRLREIPLTPERVLAAIRA
jgi:nicotinate dehydrogenase subunit B